PFIGKDYPADLPIVNADPDTIEGKLEALVQNAALRNELGRKSRAYVEKYHDDQINARELVGIYEEVIDLHRGKRES
ncbi:MAG TPA: hypothetical protein VJL58_01260, partial [Pyrinomonadaceae bacterium]|nr:hypothetical protein [Pyrinomonadaceae bacterium]